MNELEQLIKEQERDDNSHYQRREPGTVSLTDRLLDVHDTTGKYVGQDRLPSASKSCHLHGRQDLAADPTRGSGFRCRACKREQDRVRYRRNHPLKPRQTAQDRRTYAREYWNRRYREDPAYREKEKARMREYRRRQKGESNEAP